MKRIASKVILLVLLSILIILIFTIGPLTPEVSGHIEVPMGCNVPQEVIDDFAESELRARVDEYGTLWWKVNYNGPPREWTHEMFGPKTICSGTVETLRIVTN